MKLLLTDHRGSKVNVWFVLCFNRHFEQLRRAVEMHDLKAVQIVALD